MVTFRKYLVIGIIFIFVGAGVIPSIYGYEKNKDYEKISYKDFKERLMHKDFVTNFPTSSRGLIQQTYQVPPNILWNKTFGGDNYDFGYKIRKTTDDGYIILGTKDGDFWLIKIDKNGVMSWSETYGSSSLDEFSMDVQQTSDGGYILVGYYFFFQEHDTGILLVKTSSDGSEEWTERFGSTYQPADAFSVYQTTDGGYLIFGNDGLNSDSLYLIKTDANGILIWESHIVGPGDWIISFDSAETGDGFIITGCVGIGYYDVDMFVMKISSEPDKQWSTTIGGELVDFGLSVIQTDNGKYAVCGVADSTEFDVYNGDAWIVQLNSQGNVEWNRVIEGDNPEILFSIKETKSGYVVVGSIIPSDPNNYNLLVYLTDGNGYKYEKWILGGNSYDEGKYVYVTSEGDYIINGYTCSYGIQGSADLWLLKIEGVNINQPPNKPVIDGPTQGIHGISYIWSFTTFDPDGDDIDLYIDWGDKTVEEWVGPYESGEEVNFSHTFDNMGYFVIKARAQDEFGNKGDWSDFTVYMPRNKQSNSNFHLLNWIFDRFPNIVPMLRYLLGPI